MAIWSIRQWEYGNKVTISHIRGNEFPDGRWTSSPELRAGRGPGLEFVWAPKARQLGWVLFQSGLTFKLGFTRFSLEYGPGYQIQATLHKTHKSGPGRFNEIRFVSLCFGKLPTLQNKSDPAHLTAGLGARARVMAPNCIHLHHYVSIVLAQARVIIARSDLIWRMICSCVHSGSTNGCHTLPVFSDFSKQACLKLLSRFLTLVAFGTLKSGPPQWISRIMIYKCETRVCWAIQRERHVEHSGKTVREAN